MQDGTTRHPTSTLSRLPSFLLRGAGALLALWLSSSVAMAAGEPERVFHVGYLALYPPLPNVGSGQIRQELAKLGYREGSNVVFDVRHASGNPDLLGAAAAELVKLRVDVIFASTIPSALAARKATDTVPIVAWGMHGAVASGLVTNLRRPGGNVTGTESLAPEIDAKRVQLFKQLIPALDRLAVVGDNLDQGVPEHLKYIQSAGKVLGITQSALLAVGRPEDFEAVLAGAAGKPLGALLVVTTNQTFRLRQRIVEFALANRLPSMCEFKSMAEAGCLVSYGPTFEEMTERCAAQIDKILRGAPPGELPVEQPTRFELVINLKTARALGLTVPQELLLRADAVIE
jgi:putative ABC transport system substrate-binding protein